MELEKRIALIEQVGEEIITREDLKQLLAEKKNPVAYDGFEPSGNVHIAQGLLRAINVNKMVKAGCKFKMLVAEWHAWANNKFAGDMEKIGKAGQFMVEVWKASGMQVNGVEFVWDSKVKADKDYWGKVMQVATNSTVKRIVRCSQIMGRNENEVLRASQIFYPCMQTADIFHLEADIAQLGMDQRKVNVLARELGEKLGYWKPVAVHHHMLLGLQLPATSAVGKEREIALKMSKSVPDSAIFMTDSAAEVERKINKAFCPEKQVEDNPVLDYCRNIVFEREKKMKIERSAKFGGDISFASYDELEKAHREGKLHPADLKQGTAASLNRLLEPVRKHFAKGKAKSLLEQVKAMQLTR